MEEEIEELIVQIQHATLAHHPFFATGLIPSPQVLEWLARLKTVHGQLRVFLARSQTALIASHSGRDRLRRIRAVLLAADKEISTFDMQMRLVEDSAFLLAIRTLDVFFRTLLGTRSSRSSRTPKSTKQQPSSTNNSNSNSSSSGGATVTATTTVTAAPPHPPSVSLDIASAASPSDSVIAQTPPKTERASAAVAAAAVASVRGLDEAGFETMLRARFEAAQRARAALMVDDAAKGPLVLTPQFRAYEFRFAKAARMMASGHRIPSPALRRILCPRDFSRFERGEITMTQKWLGFVLDDGREFLTYHGKHGRYYVDEESDNWMPFPQDWYFRGTFKFLGQSWDDEPGPKFSVLKDASGRFLICYPAVDGTWYYCDWSGSVARWVPLPEEKIAMGTFILDNLTERGAVTATRVEVDYSVTTTSSTGEYGFTAAESTVVEEVSNAVAAGMPGSGYSSNGGGISGGVGASSNGYTLWRRSSDGAMLTTVLVAEPSIGYVRYYYDMDEWILFPDAWEADGAGVFPSTGTNKSLPDEPVYGTFIHPNGEAYAIVLIRAQSDLNATYYLDESTWRWLPTPPMWNLSYLHGLNVDNSANDNNDTIVWVPPPWTAAA